MNKRIIYPGLVLLLVAAASLVVFNKIDTRQDKTALKQSEAVSDVKDVDKVPSSKKSIDRAEASAPGQGVKEAKSKQITVTGQELAQMVYDRNDGDTVHSITEMILVDKNGHERKRIMETYTKDFDSLVKGLIEFNEPPDIQGTRFLSWENEERDDTQYLFLPELGRARRIVSNQKKLRFVNTDFSYEDMQRRKPDEDEHTITGTTVYLNRPAYVLKSVPKPGTSQYGLRQTVVDQESLLPVSVDFYNTKGKRIKEFRVHEIEKISGIWTAMKLEMRDLKANHATLMNLKEIEYNGNLRNKYFELRNLER